MIPGLIRKGVRHSISDSALLGAPLRRRLSHTFLALDGDSCASFYFDNFYSAFSQNEQMELLTEEIIGEAGKSKVLKNLRIAGREHAIRAEPNAQIAFMPNTSGRATCTEWPPQCA